MAARFTGQFYSAYTAQQYTVIVYDADFVGASSEITIASCEYNYPQGNAGRFDPVLSAEASTKILVQTAGVDTFVEDLAGAEEGRFMLQILQGISSQFIGYILPDLAQQEDTTLEVGYLLELRATDGLARLKAIDYNNAGTVYSGEETVTGHVLNCLNKLTALMDFYAGGSELLRTRVNWHSDQHTYTVGDEDPAQLTRIPHRAFYTIDTRGNYKYMSCFDVLTEICRAWGARMLFSDYAFWFVQYNEMATDATQTVFNYTKTGTQTSASVDFRKDHDQDDDASDLVRRSGGIYRFCPPLMKTQVDYRHIATRNLLAGWSAGTPETGVNIDDYNNTAVFYFSGQIVYSISDMFTPGDLPLWITLRLKIRVGTSYLSRTGSISGGIPTYGTLQFTNDNTDRYDIIVMVTQEDVQEAYSYTFYSPVIPTGGGEFEFDTQQGSIFKLDGSLYVDVATVYTSLQGAYMELLFEGTLDNQADIRRFVSTNNTAGNSAMTEIITIIGDGIGTNSPGHLESYDGSAWVLSDGWRVGASGSYLAHSALLAQEVQRGQLTPIRKFQGEYNNRNTSLYRPHNVVKRADGIMMFSGGRFVPGVDSVQGEWFFISPQASGWTNEPYEDIPADQSSNAGRPSGGGSGSGGGTTTPVRIFSQHFDTVTANTVTVTVNGGTLPTNADALMVFWNGQLITAAFYTVTGSDIAFTFDVTDNVTVKFFIQ